MTTPIMNERAWVCPPQVRGLNATPAGNQRQAGLRFSNEEEKIKDTKLWLADGGMTQVDAEYGIKTAARLAQAGQLAEEWPGCTPNQRPLMAFTFAFTLSEFSPDGHFAPVEVKNGFFSPPILFLEFAELMKMYLESGEVQELVPVCPEKGCEFEQKKARIADRLYDKAGTCMGTEEKLEDYLLLKDMRAAVDYYYAMVEARDILMTTMGRALVRAGQLGGSVWCHLYAMHGEGKLWDGAKHNQPVLPWGEQIFYGL